MTSKKTETVASKIEGLRREIQQLENDTQLQLASSYPNHDWRLKGLQEVFWGEQNNFLLELFFDTKTSITQLIGEWIASGGRPMYTRDQARILQYSGPVIVEFDSIDQDLLRQKFRSHIEFMNAQMFEEYVNRDTGQVYQQILFLREKWTYPSPVKQNSGMRVWSVPGDGNCGVYALLMIIQYVCVAHSLGLPAKHGAIKSDERTVLQIMMETCEKLQLKQCIHDAESKHDVNADDHSENTANRLFAHKSVLKQQQDLMMAVNLLGGCFSSESLSKLYEFDEESLATLKHGTLPTAYASYLETKQQRNLQVSQDDPKWRGDQTTFGQHNHERQMFLRNMLVNKSRELRLATDHYKFGSGWKLEETLAMNKILKNKSWITDHELKAFQCIFGIKVYMIYIESPNRGMNDAPTCELQALSDPLDAQGKPIKLELCCFVLNRNNVHWEPVSLGWDMKFTDQTNLAAPQTQKFVWKISDLEQTEWRSFL